MPQTAEMPQHAIEEFTATLGPQGRLVIPAELRKQLELEAGTVLTITREEGRIYLTSRAAARAAAKAMFRGVPRTRSLVDELIADRRAEAAREIAEG